MHPAERFTDRAEDYARWRPGYPAGIVALLDLPAGARIADIGAGTGIAAELFASHGYDVVGVEPNAEMRARARVPVVDGAGEATGLPGAAFDAVICAQAFHWMDHEAAKREFLRILKPGGVIALLWNDRLEDVDAFARGLAGLIAGRNNVGVRPDLSELFKGYRVEEHVFRHAQSLGWEGLVGRVRSASYVPLDDPAFFARLRELFDEHQREQRAGIWYDCRVYLIREPGAL
jgi:SAM-dependent methyltransferase